MKKVLLINEQYPLHENSGAHQRTMLFARHFKQYADVDLVYSQKMGNVCEDADIFRKQIYIPRQDFPTRYKDHAVLIIKGFPRCIRVRHSVFYRKTLFSMIEKEAYDLIFIRYAFNAQYFLHMPENIRKKIILDLDDLISGPLYSLVTKYAFKKWFDYQLAVYYEKKVCRKLYKILFCSQHDLKKNVYNRFKNTCVVPNVVNLPHFKNYDFSDGFSMDNIFLFIGSLDYVANIEGLEWFVKTIYKPFRKKNNNSKLLVVGKYPKENVKKLINNTEGADLHANVHDVRPYYAKSRLVVVPLLTGSGTRIKILEAALTGRPVISTPVGAEGLSFQDGVDILLFNDADSFNKNIELLRNKNNYDKISNNAKERTKSDYSLRAFNNSFNDVVKDFF
jgi:glycosyltransferase involved in cell wall biosynthesis